MSTYTQKTAREVLKPFGVTFRRDSSGDYVVRLAYAKAGEGYFTDDIDDAVDTGIYLARSAAAQALETARANRRDAAGASA
jgi:hypothetical protein